MIDQRPESFQHFRDTVGRGLVAHLMVISHFVHKNTLEKLLHDGRYGKLSLAYADYMPALAEGSCTPGQLAARLNTSKQACSKIIRELEKLALVQRSPNPADSRSSLLSLTDKGLQLLRDGMQLTVEIHAELARSVGAETLQELERVLLELCAALGVEQPSYRFASAELGSAPKLNALLTLLSEALRQRLAVEIAESGFDGLKTSFGQIIGLLGRQGRHVQYMASILGISKQSVAVTVAEMDAQGYVQRAPDPSDRRQVIVRLSPKGENLLARSVSCSLALQDEIRALLGEADFHLLESTLEALYLQMAERYDSAGVLPARIQQLSDFLLDELGVAGTRTLAQHLLSITRGNS